MKYYTLLEVAEILNVGLETIRRYVRAGQLKAVKLARNYRIKDTDLEKFVELKSNVVTIKKSM